MNTLLMPFKNESKDFVLGFEAGQIWELIGSGEIIENKLFHSEQSEQIELICKSYGCQYKIIIVDETWSSLCVGTILN